LKKNVSKTSLQTIIFRHYLSISIFITLLFSTIFYSFAIRNLIESQIENLNNINSSFQQQVDQAINNLDITSANINYSNMSKNTLDDYFNLTITDSTLKDLASLFIAVSGSDLKTDQINLYDYSGNVLQVGLSTMTKQADAKSMEWVEKTKETGGSKIITTPYKTSVYSKSINKEQWYISLYRSFFNQYGRSVGAIETIKSCKQIFKSVISYQKKNRDTKTKVYIFDDDGCLVYPYDINEDEYNLLSQYFCQTSDSINKPFASPIDKKMEYCSRVKSAYSGYTYITVMPKAEILKPVYNMLKIFIICTLLILIIVTVIGSRLSISITKPVKHLKHVIQRMELDTIGQEEVTDYPVSVDELVDLYEAFQHMNDKLKDSMKQLMDSREQEIKSRSLALQTQMNPHFYYNSLSSIMVLAENNDTDEVVMMCKNLSRIMRYITDTGNAIVTLKDELDYVEKYLYCMKVRYQSSLNYTIDVDESLYSINIPKLIIQPIVENAIKYGSDCTPPWNISISSQKTDSYWKITVTDSGNGFTKEALDKIAENIKRAQENPGLPELKINGLGTLNVYLRWNLFCKEEMIFEYGNDENGHGQVSVGRFTTKQ